MHVAAMFRNLAKTRVENGWYSGTILTARLGTYLSRKNCVSNCWLIGDRRRKKRLTGFRHRKSLATFFCATFLGGETKKMETDQL